MEAKTSSIQLFDYCRRYSPYTNLLDSLFSRDPIDRH